MVNTWQKMHRLDQPDGQRCGGYNEEIYMGKEDMEFGVREAFAEDRFTLNMVVTPERGSIKENTAI